MNIQLEYLEENGTLWAKHLFGPTWEQLMQISPEQKLWAIPQEVVNRVDELNTRSSDLLAMDLIREVRRLRIENVLLKRQNEQLHEPALQESGFLLEGENNRLHIENNELKVENFWLRSDTKRFDWDDDSTPWGFSKS